MNLGPWLGQSFRLLAERPGQYALIGLVWFGISLAASLVLGAPAIGLVIALDALQMPEWTLWMVVPPTVLALWTAQGVALAGMHRAIHRLIDEGEWSFGDTVPMDIAWSAAGLSLIMTLATMASMLLCFLPLIPLMGAWGMALPALVEEEGGALGSLRRSWELSQDRYGELCLYFLIAGVLFVVTSYIPLVGPILAWPVMTMMSIVPYKALAGEAAEAPRELIEVQERDADNPYQAPRRV